MRLKLCVIDSWLSSYDASLVLACVLLLVYDGFYKVAYISLLSPRLYIPTDYTIIIPHNTFHAIPHLITRPILYANTNPPPQLNLCYNAHTSAYILHVEFAIRHVALPISFSTSLHLILTCVLTQPKCSFMPTASHFFFFFFKINTRMWLRPWRVSLFT